MAKRDEERLAVLRERARAWRAAHPERAAQIAKKARRTAAEIAARAEGRDTNQPRSRKRLSDDERAAKRKALVDKHNGFKKAAAAERALAEGREPGRVGRPPRLTAEEREVSRLTQNKKRSKRSLARRTTTRAVKALAEGRVPGRTGPLRRLTDEQRIVRARERTAKYKAEHADDVRAADAEAGRQKRAAKAIAEGRVPGVIGALNRLSPEEFAAYLKAWPDRESVFHARLKTQNSRARRLGAEGVLTFADLQKVVVEQRGYCAFCGNPLGDESPEIDHWHPLARGGNNTADNARLLHKRCNRTKGARMPIDFLTAAHAPPPKATCPSTPRTRSSSVAKMVCCAGK